MKARCIIAESLRSAVASVYILLGRHFRLKDSSHAAHAKKLLTSLDNSVKIPFAAYWGCAVCTENKRACAHGSESIFKVG